MYKYRTLIGNIKHSYGNINNLSHLSLNNVLHNSDWVSWRPFNYKKCQTCKVLPLCMGGCTYNCYRQSNEPECTEWEYLLKKQLLAIYERKYLTERR